MTTATECDMVRLSVVKQCETMPEKYRGIYRQAMTGRRALKAIRANCLYCNCWQESEVRKCGVYHCPLWPYRMGRLAPLVDATADSFPKTPGEEAATGEDVTKGHMSQVRPSDGNVQPPEANLRTMKRN
jgi:hypothetical protein